MESLLKVATLELATKAASNSRPTPQPAKPGVPSQGIVLYSVPTLQLFPGVKMNDKVEQRVRKFFDVLVRNKKRHIDAPICPTCLTPRHVIMLDTKQISRVECFRKHISCRRCPAAHSLVCYCEIPTSEGVPPEAHNINCPVAIWFPWCVNLSAPLPSPVRAPLRPEWRYIEETDTSILVPSSQRCAVPLPVKLPEPAPLMLPQSPSRPRLQPTELIPTTSVLSDPNSGLPKQIEIKDEKHGCDVIMAIGLNIHRLVDWNKDCEKKFAGYINDVHQRHVVDLQRLQAKHSTEVLTIESRRKECLKSTELRWARLLGLQQDVHAQLSKFRSLPPPPPAATPVATPVATDVIVVDAVPEASPPALPSSPQPPATPKAAVVDLPSPSPDVVVSGKDEKKVDASPELEPKAVTVTEPKPKPKPRGRPTGVRWAANLSQVREFATQETGDLSLKITTVNARKRKTTSSSPVKEPGAKKHSAAIAKQKPMRDLMFRTGKTDSIRFPDMELCAVPSKYGRWTLVWRPQKGLPKTLHMRNSMIGVEWVHAPVDEDTGLNQVDGRGQNGWGVEDAAFIGFMMGEFRFDSKFFVVAKNEFGKFASEGYERLIV